MRVVHLSCVAPPETGGIGSAAFLEVRSLIERGIESSLIATAGRALVSAPPIRRLPVAGRFGNAAFLRHGPLARAVADADIVHLHYPFYGAAGTVARMRRHGQIKRLVMTLHMDAQAGGWKGMVFDAHRLLFQRRVLDSADARIVSSTDYAEHSSFAPWSSSAIELPFGVDPGRFCPGEGDRGRFNIPKDASVVVFVGGMDAAHAFKGVDVLLEAIASVPDAVCVLVGDGDLRAGYEQHAAALGISSRVRFLGRIAEADLPTVYRLADVLAFPSTSGAEAFGLVALEAQACGVPVVASRLPGVRTVVEDGVTGTLVPPKDPSALAAALGDMLTDTECRNRMGTAARARVLTKFTWTRHMDGLVEVYNELCASPS